MKTPRLTRRAAVTALGGAAAASLLAGCNSDEPDPDESPSAPGVQAPMVLAHYMPCFPTSLDNEPSTQDHYATQYLQISGEGRRYAAQGGYLRDRPLPVPTAGDDWRVVNAAREVETAKKYAIDGFTVDLLSLSGQWWDNAVALWQAAEEAGGFALLPMVDMDALGSLTAQEVADSIAPLMRSAVAGRVDGKIAYAAYRPEGKPVSFWRELNTLLNQAVGSEVAFQAVCLDTSSATVKSVAQIASHIASWGPRAPEAVPDEARVRREVLAAGSQYVGTVAVQDYRPVRRVYSEARNTSTLRRSWEAAIANKSSWVHIATWNDYAENTGVAPSVAHGEAFLRIIDGYARRYKGLAASDEEFIVLTARRQLAQSIPRLATSRASSTLSFATNPVNQVELHTQTTAPITLRVTVGTRTSTIVHAGGARTTTMPLTVGPVRVQALRDGREVTGVLNTPTVSATPQIGDYLYHAASAAIGQ